MHQPPGQQEAAVKTVLSNTPVRYPRVPVVFFLEVDKTSADMFGILARLLEHLSTSENLARIATATTKAALGTVQLCFNYFAGLIFQVTWHAPFHEAKARNAPDVTYTLSCLLVPGDDHRSLPNFRCFSRVPGHLTHMSQSKTPRFKALSISDRISSQPATFPAFNVLTARKKPWQQRWYFPSSKVHPVCPSD